MILLVMGLLASCGGKKPEKTPAKGDDTTAVASYGRPIPNAYLADNCYAVTHFDPGQSDAFPYEVPKGTFNVDLSKFPLVYGGPIALMQMYSTDPGYMWATTVSSVSYVDIRNNGWKEMARIIPPGMKAITKEAVEEGLRQTITSATKADKVIPKHWMDNYGQTGNVYMLVDKDNVLFSNTNTLIVAYGLVDPRDPLKGIKVLRTYDFAPELKKLAAIPSTNPTIKAYGGGIIFGLSLTYDGKVVVTTTRSISVIDRELKKAPQTFVFGPEEAITNSICIDENNGIYVASDKLMHKLVWTGSRLSDKREDGAWSSPYDLGPKPPYVRLGTGTGSTPTLMGFGDDEDKLVVITDGAKHMNIVAFWRNEIPADAKQQPGTKSPRIAGQMTITCGLSSLPEFIQSEQSVVVQHYGAFVVNNMRKEGSKDKIVDLLTTGPVYPQAVGCERVEWYPRENKWRSVWTRNDVGAISMVPAMSTGSGVAFSSGYTIEDGWELTGMDWNTGQTVTRYIFGKTNYGNGACATIQFMPNKDLLFNSIGGPIRVHVNE